MKTLVKLLLLLLSTTNILAQADSSKSTESEKDYKKRIERERKESERQQKDKYKFFVVNSEPEGATVELGGKNVGVTPYQEVVKENYIYNGPRFAFSNFIPRPISMTVSKEGYVSKTLIITKGPFEWVSLNGQNRIIFHVITQPAFNIKLEKVGQFLGNNPFSSEKNAQISIPNSNSLLSVEQVVSQSLPAVVTVKSATGSGSGFFILPSGIVVTNRHVVEDSQTVSVITSKGESFKSSSIFVHPTKDLALIKIDADGKEFPFLQIADPSSVNIGSDVIAIGSPGIGSTILENSVTKGILSSFRDLGDRGLFVQTDAALNHGNSGGALLNLRGEVIGVNTLGFADFNKEGMNFAIFASEILAMLKEHFNFVPNYPSKSNPLPQTEEKSNKISVQITSEPSGAEIFIDGAFVGSTPSKITLTSGEHTIKIARTGYKEWERKVNLSPENVLSFNAILSKEPE